MNNWSEKTKPYVDAKLPGCSAKNFYEPSVKKVLTKITCKDDFFYPKNNNNFVDLYANCSDRKSIAMRHFSSEVIDCGFRIKTCAGYKVCFCLDKKWSEKGIIISGSNYLESQEECDFKFNILNINENLIVINHKDKIGKMWLEPVYMFELE